MAPRSSIYRSAVFGLAAVLLVAMAGRPAPAAAACVSGLDYGGIHYEGRPMPRAVTLGRRMGRVFASDCGERPYARLVQTYALPGVPGRLALVAPDPFGRRVLMLAPGFFPQLRSSPLHDLPAFRRAPRGSRCSMGQRVRGSVVGWAADDMRALVQVDGGPLVNVMPEPRAHVRAPRVAGQPFVEVGRRVWLRGRLCPSRTTVFVTSRLTVLGPRPRVAWSVNRKAATEDAASSLAALRLPAGGRRVSRRAVERRTRGRAPTEFGVPAVIPPFTVRRLAWWTVPSAAAGVWRWLRDHSPAGSTVEIMGTGSGPGAAPMRAVTFTRPGVPRRLRWRALSLVVVSIGRGLSLVRADAMTIWEPDFAAAAVIPAGVDEVTIESADPDRPATTIRDHTVVQALINIINNLHTPFPGTHSCPSTGALPPPVVGLTFRASQRPEPVATATVDLSGCPTVRLGVVERLKLGDPEVLLDSSPELEALVRSLQRPGGTLQ